MNVTLPEKEKMNKKILVVYIIAVIICLLAIVVTVSVVILGNDVVDNMFGINKLVKRSYEEENKLKANFEEMINNTSEEKLEYYSYKIDKEKQLIYTDYEKQEKKNDYELNVNIPKININGKDVEEFNKEIADTFKAKAEEILNKKENNSAYTVKYKGYINNNIVSLIIYSNLKQGTSAQRVIIQTFNYDLEQNKKINLEDTIKIYNLSKNEVQNKIDSDMKEEEKKANELKELGYNLFSRNLDSDYYKVENVEEFFIYNENIYIIFAYGNTQITSQKDIVII